MIGSGHLGSAAVTRAAADSVHAGHRRSNVAGRFFLALFYSLFVLLTPVGCSCVKQIN